MAKKKTTKKKTVTVKRKKKGTKKRPAEKKESGRRKNGTFGPGNPHAFKPGESGNPAGRPQSALLSTAYKKHLSRRCDNADFIAMAGFEPDDNPTWADVIAMGIIRSAVMGKTTSAKEIRETTEGNMLTVAPDWRSALKDMGLNPDDAVQILTDEFMKEP